MSDTLQQVLLAVEPSFGNLALSAARTPAVTGLTYVGLPCADPTFSAEIGIAENNATSNKFFSRPNYATTKRATIALDLYLRATGAGLGLTAPQFELFDNMFGKSSDSAASYTIDARNSSTEFEVSDATGLAVGQGFAVLIDGVKHTSFIKTIAGVVITCGPALPSTFVVSGPSTMRGGRTYAIGQNFRADNSLSLKLLKEDYSKQTFGVQGTKLELPLVTGEMVTAKVSLSAGYCNPVATAEAVGATDEPAATWLKFLNGECLIDGVSHDVRAVNWSIDLQAKPLLTPANALGMSGWEMGKPQITAAVELSRFDADYPTAFDAQTEVSLLCYMGTSANGSAVAIYCPKMHLTKYPEPSAADELTTMPLDLRLGDYSGDTGTFDGASESSLVDTVWRIFFERGA